MGRDIAAIVKGQQITATRLNEYGEGINTLNREQVNAPRQDGDTDLGVPVEEVTGPNTYIETTRTTSEVQVFDDEDTNYALIDRIDTVTFENSEGDIITLQFNNT